MKNQVDEQDRIWLLKEKYGNSENNLSAKQTKTFHADCKRLTLGEPLGYVIGHVPFLDCEIWLDSHPLIPRPETEYWVERAIDEISLSLSKRRGLTPLVLDLCAGSGAIGIAVAKAIPKAHVTFVEIDEAHLPTIKKNLSYNLPPYPNRLGYGGRNNSTVQEASSIGLINDKPDSENTIIYDSILAKRFFVVQSDLLEKVEGVFDFILTNPPYIDAQANTVESSVAEHEPHLALFGGEAGMEVITKIVEEARASLAPHGQLWIEHEPFQSDAIAKLAQEHGFAITTHNDQYNIPRYSILKPG